MPSRDWWEAHYAKGGASGTGSVGDLRSWKWARIGEVREVLDYGCGDLSFWDGHARDEEVSYVGIDPSPTIIEKDKRYRPAWTFYTLEEWLHFAGYQNRRDTVICFDVLFHVVEEDEYDRILSRLFMYAKRRVLIYTWRRNPFTRSHAAREIVAGILHGRLFKIRQWARYLIHPSDGDGVFQKFRRPGKLFEAMHHARFHVFKVYDAPDGLGVLYDFRADDEEEPTFTGSKKAAPFYADLDPPRR